MKTKKNQNWNNIEISKTFYETKWSKQSDKTYNQAQRSVNH